MTLGITHILCATDFSEYSDRAIPYGIKLAEKTGATLIFGHVIDLPSVAMYGEAMFDPQAIQEKISAFAQERLAELVGDAGATWEVMVSSGTPAEELARMAAERQVDLAISATHGRSGLERLILGSVTERLMHTLPCPLLVVHDQAPDQKAIEIGRILVGCDFSPDAGLAVEYGVKLAKSFNAELELIHVIEPHSFKDVLKPWRGPGGDPAPEIRARLDFELASQVSEADRRQVKVGTTLLTGQPHEELVKQAVIQGADLIILGVHGRGFVEKLLVGSTTDRVIRLAPCPVLAVRPK